MEIDFDILLDFAEKYRNTLLSIFVILSLFILAKISRRALKRHFLKNSQAGFDKTNYQFLNNGMSFVFLIIGLILVFNIIPSLKAVGITLFAGAGIFAAIIGFASQAAFSNIISGIFIVIFKPFRIGDILQLQTEKKWGIVEDITLRHTVIKSFQNERFIVPNSKISDDTILNASIGEAKTCMFLEMGISYDSDVDLAIKIMQEEAQKHPNLIDNRNEEQLNDGTPLVVVRLIGFGDSSVNLRAYLWAEDFIKGFVMQTDLYKTIKKRFDSEGIEIPFPYRTIVYKNDPKK